MAGKAASIHSSDGGEFSCYLAMPEPEDFLIGADGATVVAKYWAYVDDHRPVDDLLALARAHAASAKSAPA